MTTWTADDKMVVTAISDSSLLVWDSKTCDLLYRLKGHKVGCFVGHKVVCLKVDK